jgi:hypothetical protein
LLSSKIKNIEIKNQSKVCLPKADGYFLSLSLHPKLEAYCDMRFKCHPFPAMWDYSAVEKQLVLEENRGDRIGKVAVYCADFAILRHGMFVSA